MTVIHADFGGASASPPFKSSLMASPNGLSAAEVAEKVKGMADSVLAERAAMTEAQRQERAEELIQSANRNFAAGGLTQLRIGSAMIQAAAIMGAPD